MKTFSIKSTKEFDRKSTEIKIKNYKIDKKIIDYRIKILELKSRLQDTNDPLEKKSLKDSIESCNTAIQALKAIRS